MGSSPSVMLSNTSSSSPTYPRSQFARPSVQDAGAQANLAIALSQSVSCGPGTETPVDAEGEDHVFFHPDSDPTTSSSISVKLEEESEIVASLRAENCRLVTEHEKEMSQKDEKMTALELKVTILKNQNLEHLSQVYKLNEQIRSLKGTRVNEGMSRKLEHLASLQDENSRLKEMLDEAMRRRREAVFGKKKRSDVEMIESDCSVPLSNEEEEGGGERDESDVASVNCPNPSVSTLPSETNETPPASNSGSSKEVFKIHDISAFGPNPPDLSHAEEIGFQTAERFLAGGRSDSISVVVENCVGGLSRQLEKAYSLFRFVSVIVTYAQGHGSAPEDVLSGGKAICEGFSSLYVALGREAGLTLRKVNGFARTLSSPRPKEDEVSNHAWTILTIDEREFIVDATWGEGSSISGVHKKEFNPTWFCRNPEVAIYTHIPTNPMNQLLENPWKKSKALDFPLYKTEALERRIRLLTHRHFVISAAPNELIRMIVSSPSLVRFSATIGDEEKDFLLNRILDTTLDEHEYEILCRAPLAPGRYDFDVFVGTGDYDASSIELESAIRYALVVSGDASDSEKPVTFPKSYGIARDTSYLVSPLHRILSKSKDLKIDVRIVGPSLARVRFGKIDLDEVADGVWESVIDLGSEEVPLGKVNVWKMERTTEGWDLDGLYAFEVVD